MPKRVYSDEDDGPKTHTLEGVRAVVEFLTDKKCTKLPATVELPFGWRLFSSEKGDCYYMTNRDRCSCPDFQHRKTCKHVASLRRQAQIAAHLIDLHDTRPGEVLYWEKKEQLRRMQTSDLPETVQKSGGFFGCTA
jgi:hypothetical protein